MATGRGRQKSFCKPKKIIGGLLGPLVLLVLLPAPANAYPRPGHTERVSVASDGTEGNGRSDIPSISGDGRYLAFDSLTSNLVPGDTNDGWDIFVRDRETGTTERVSVASDGSEANARSFEPKISADGNHVVFYSFASNLVAGDTNAAPDVFVHDRQTRTTERVSVASDGSEGMGLSFRAVISADGRYVAFGSSTPNLVPGDTNNTVDVFVHDRLARTTERVSVASDGSQANHGPVSSGGSAAISGDGRYVAFESDAANIVAGDTNGVADVFVRDREAGTTERVSVATDGAEGNRLSIGPVISADGRHVAFRSTASNLLPGDTNGEMDVFVHDREAGTTERVSLATDGAEGNESSTYPAISADGRHVAFYSGASNLVPGDTNGVDDVFLHDREVGTTERMSEAADGSEANQASHLTAISGDGRHVAFRSLASNLVARDTNSTLDVFVRDRGPATGIGGLAVQGGTSELTVSGWATFSGVSVAVTGDPSEDGSPGAEGMGAELTGASLTYQPEQEALLITLGLTSLPGERCTDRVCEWGGGVHGALAPGILHRRILYAMRFDHGSTSWEVRARSGSTVKPPGEPVSDPPHFALYRCDPDCTEHASLAGGIGTAGPEVRVLMPLSALGASEGAPLTRIRAHTSREGGAVEAGEAMDEADLPDTLIPASRVELGIAPASTSEDEVAFTVEAELLAGDFSGTISTDGLSAGSYRVWARACLGDVCGPAAFEEVVL